MKFSAVTQTTTYPESKLEETYKAAHAVGVLRIGDDCLFFRAKRRTWYIPFSEIRGCFRRVMLVPAKLCCGRGDFQVENLVIVGDEGELAQIQLPGTRAAKAVIEELKALLPDADFSVPEKKETEPA